MLNVYYGREDLIKEKFIFESIKKSRQDNNGEVIMIVPDQYTLQAERDAFFYLKEKILLDMEIVSFSRLATMILSETGGGRKTLIDKRGRHMLLFRILAKMNNELELYKGSCSNNAFIDMTNNFISEMKQYGVSPEMLAEIKEHVDDKSFLYRKLSDIEKIYTEYEKRIKGKYIDTEDQIDIFSAKISESKKIQEKTVWVYGFDYFTPKNLQIISKLRDASARVNIVMTWDDRGPDKKLFGITGEMIKKLRPENCFEIGREYLTERVFAIGKLEKEVFALPSGTYDKAEGIELVEAANFYAEAETAAAFIRKTVREKGISYKDIAVICNDMTERGSICKRVFAEYGIELFMDRKRDIMHSPIVSYIISLLKIIGGGYKTEDIFSMLKTGLAGFENSEIEGLENYAHKYKVRGSAWKKEFVKGETEYGKDGIKELNDLRWRLVQPIEALSKALKEGKTVSEKISLLYDFLADTSGVPEKTETLIAQQKEAGHLEEAEETAQIWNVTAGLMDQMVGIIGEEKISMKDLASLFEAGFSSVEIGVLPPAADGLIMGTMQRTRISSIKIMMILGANEGVLPANAAGEDILNDDEKTLLLNKGMEICKIDRLRNMEEDLAIYRNLTKAKDLVWISWSASDTEGKRLKPSSLFSKVREIFPDAEVKKDIVSRCDAFDLVETEKSTLKHLTHALGRKKTGQELEEPWKEVISWYRENGKTEIAMIKDGLLYKGKEKDPEKALTDILYGISEKGSISISPSRLECYGRCPFSHFVRYGLRPDERKQYEVGPADMGDIYHRCLMLLSKALTTDMAVTSEGSPWMTVTRDQCRQMVQDFVAAEKNNYREGILAAGGEQNYRVKRMEEVCEEASWQMIEHVRKGRIEKMAFEEPFGRGKSIGPIEICTGEEKTGEKAQIYIEGKIDRVDMLPGQNVKVIDYKSGADKYDEKDVKAGIKLQLILYLRAAAGKEKNEDKKRYPAGTFYFHVKEPDIDAGEMNFAQKEIFRSELEENIRKTFRMDGVMVNKPEVLDSITGGYPLVISSKGKGRAMEEKEFNDMLAEIYEKADSMCRSLLQGNISKSPKRKTGYTSCTYCGYKGICRFDTAFSQCRFEKI